jgi:hypothetical protein
MLRKSYQSAPHRGPSVVLLAVLLAIFVLLALSASVVGRVGIDSPERPLRAAPGFAAGVVA